jgi:hypothetical protein
MAPYKTNQRVSPSPHCNRGRQTTIVDPVGRPRSSQVKAKSLKRRQQRADRAEAPPPQSWLRDEAPDPLNRARDSSEPGASEDSDGSDAPDITSGKVEQAARRKAAVDAPGGAWESWDWGTGLGTQWRALDRAAHDALSESHVRPWTVLPVHRHKLLPAAMLQPWRADAPYTPLFVGQRWRSWPSGPHTSKGQRWPWASNFSNTITRRGCAAVRLNIGGDWSWKPTEARVRLSWTVNLWSKQGETLKREIARRRSCDREATLAYYGHHLRTTGRGVCLSH